MVEFFKTLKSVSKSQTVIEKSKFICEISPISCEEDAKNFISEIKKKYTLATHYCYAYIADENGLNVKFSDDGEPQGTAGFPMLEVLKKNGIFKVCAVVTRYFGGIKLGTGGLSRAYSNSVLTCLSETDVYEMFYSYIFSLKADYSAYNSIKHFLQTKNIKIISSDFLDGVLINCAAKVNDFINIENLKSEIADRFSGAIFSLIKTDYTDF